MSGSPQSPWPHGEIRNPSGHRREVSDHGPDSSGVTAARSTPGVVALAAGGRLGRAPKDDSRGRKASAQDLHGWRIPQTGARSATHHGTSLQGQLWSCHFGCWARPPVPSLWGSLRLCGPDTHNEISRIFAFTHLFET